MYQIYLFLDLYGYGFMASYFFATGCNPLFPFFIFLLLSSQTRPWEPRPGLLGPPTARPLSLSTSSRRARLALSSAAGLQVGLPSLGSRMLTTHQGPGGLRVGPSQAQVTPPQWSTCAERPRVGSCFRRPKHLLFPGRERDSVQPLSAKTPDEWAARADLPRPHAPRPAWSFLGGRRRRRRPRALASVGHTCFPHGGRRTQPPSPRPP